MQVNAAKHLLMFNYRGDPNGRHNLPGEPMLDYATSVFAVLGAGLALTRLREPRQFLLPIWLLIMLAGGVFSLDFEAPQSLRAIGSLPPAYLLAGLALGIRFVKRVPQKTFTFIIQGLSILAGLQLLF